MYRVFPQQKRGHRLAAMASQFGFSDAQTRVLLHSIGVGVKNGLEDVSDELVHLLGCTAHKILRHQTGHDLLFGQAKGGVRRNAVHQLNDIFA